MPTQPVPQQNLLLAALHTDAVERIFPRLERVSMPPGLCLTDTGATATAVYFPTECVVSLLYATDNARASEFAVVGNEGVIGVSPLMDTVGPPAQVIVHHGGSAYRLSAAVLKDEVNRYGELMVLLLRYAQSLLAQMAQTALCRRHHSFDAQVCRWILLSLDRLAGTPLSITSAMVARLFGVTPAEVTALTAELQRVGLLSYASGRFTIRNRARVEDRCCECYAVVRQEAERLLPYLRTRMRSVAPPEQLSASRYAAPFLQHGDQAS